MEDNVTGAPVALSYHRTVQHNVYLLVFVGFNQIVVNAGFVKMFAFN